MTQIDPTTLDQFEVGIDRLVNDGLDVYELDPEVMLEILEHYTEKVESRT